jgi:type IV pilus assembly protein PilN
MQFKINLATRTYIDTKQLNLWLGVITLLLLSWSIYITINIANNIGNIKQLQSVTTKKSTAVYQPSTNEYQELRKKIGFVNNIIARKTFDWLQLLDQLETVVPVGVALSSIDPDIKKKELKLSGFVRNFTNLRALMENLETSKFLSDVYLISQTPIQVGETEKGISFTISCKVRI